MSLSCSNVTPETLIPLTLCNNYTSFSSQIFDFYFKIRGNQDFFFLSSFLPKKQVESRSTQFGHVTIFPQALRLVLPQQSSDRSVVCSDGTGGSKSLLCRPEGSAASGLPSKLTSRDCDSHINYSEGDNDIRQQKWPRAPCFRCVAGGCSGSDCGAAPPGGGMAAHTAAALQACSGRGLCVEWPQLWPHLKTCLISRRRMKGTTPILFFTNLTSITNGAGLGTEKGC